MADDFRVRSSFPLHPKVRKLERRLGDAGPWRLMVLWAWMAAEDNENGSLAGMDDDDIELACDWRGEPGAFVEALVAVGFVGGAERERYVKDWEEHQPWVAGAKARKSKAKAAAEARWNRKPKAKDEDATSMPDACNEHATSMRGACSEDATSTIEQCPFPPTILPTNQEGNQRGEHDPPPRASARGRRLERFLEIDPTKIDTPPPPAGWIQWAVEQHPEIEDVAETWAKFCRYWFAKAGKDASKRDWYRTWQNWVARDAEAARERQARTGGLNGSRKATPDQRRHERLAEWRSKRVGEAGSGPAS